MKYLLICVLLYCSSVFVSGDEVDNEIGLNEIDVDGIQKANWQDYTTKNPFNPKLTYYTKNAQIRFKHVENPSSEQSVSRNSEKSSESSQSGESSVSSESVQIKKNRQKRSSNDETTNIDFPTTTAEIYKLNTNEASTPSNTESLPSTTEENYHTVKTEDADFTADTTTHVSEMTAEIDVKDETEEENIISKTTETNEGESVKEKETLTENLIKVNESLLDTALQNVDNLSNQIRTVLQHYQKAGVVALPGKQLLPDPLPMADLQNNIGFGTVMTFTNMSVYGLNNFTVEHVNTDVDKLQVYLLLHMKRVIILGNYTLKTFFRRSAGAFNVTLIDVDSEGAAELQPDENGHLQASESQMDMSTKNMKTDFKNLKSTLLSSVIDGAGIFLFDSMKPAILEKVNTVLRSDFNKKLKTITTKLTSAVSPVDIAMAEGRRYCKSKGYDPYHIQNYQSNQGLFDVTIKDFLLEGMSRFYRVGNLSISMDSGIVQIGIHVVTGQLNGTCDWSIAVGKYERKSNSSFTVDYLQVRALVNQSLDLRKHPQLEDLDVGLGRVNLKVGSDSPIDLMIARVVNSLPKLIRHIIVDAVEQPLKEKVQEILNDVNVNEIVEERLPELDKFGL